MKVVPPFDDDRAFINEDSSVPVSLLDTTSKTQAVFDYFNPKNLADCLDRIINNSWEIGHISWL